MGRREVRALIPSALGSACHLDIPCTITRRFTRWNKGRLQQAGWDLLECLNIGACEQEGDKHAGRHVATEDDSSLIKASRQGDVAFRKQYTRENRLAHARVMFVVDRPLVVEEACGNKASDFRERKELWWMPPDLFFTHAYVHACKSTQMCSKFFLHY